jgi:hypothetical protein
MRRPWSMALALPIALVLVVSSPSRAEAITIKEIIELTKAGVAEDVLLALIEIDRRVFPIDVDTLTALKRGGVSDRVIMAVVKSGRTPAPEPEPTPVVQNEPIEPPPPPQPQVVVIEHETPVSREVLVPVPVYVAVDSHRRVRTHRSTNSYDDVRSPFVPFGPVPSTINLPPRPKPAAPVYWGWGGKLRPDAWKPTPEK